MDYIWEQRANQINNRFSKRIKYVACDALFISMKTGSFYLPKSIGNVLKSAFAALEVEGSGHRLRAAFVTEAVRAAYLRARAIHGKAFDQASILLDAAELLGHASTETLGSYLNRVRREENSMEGEPILVQSPEEARYIRGMVEALQYPDSPQAHAIKKFFKESGIEPLEEDCTVQDIRDKIKLRKRVEESIDHLDA